VQFVFFVSSPHLSLVLVVHTLQELRKLCRAGSSTVHAKSAVDFEIKRRSEWASYWCTDYWVILQWVTLLTFAVVLVLRLWCIGWTSVNAGRLSSSQ